MKTIPLALGATYPRKQKESPPTLEVLMLSKLEPLEIETLDLVLEEFELTRIEAMGQVLNVVRQYVPGRLALLDSCRDPDRKSEMLRESLKLAASFAGYSQVREFIGGSLDPDFDRKEAFRAGKILPFYGRLYYSQRSLPTCS